MRHLRSMLSTALPTAARAALLAGLLTAAAHAAGFPKPQGVVTDAASILTGASKVEAEALIHEAARKTTAEIAIATVSSLDGLSVEEYATRLFNEWGIGKKGADNGVLILRTSSSHSSGCSSRPAASAWASACARAPVSRSFSEASSAGRRS